MEENFIEKKALVVSNLTAFSAQMGNVMKNFQAFHKSVIDEGILDKKEKELIALCIAVVTHCDACILYHLDILIKMNIKKEEIQDALGVVVLMGGGPGAMYAAKTLKAFEELSQK